MIKTKYLRAKPSQLPPSSAVLCPLDNHMGIDIARALGSAGVNVYGVDRNKYIPGRYSKYCRFIHCPYSEETQEDRFIQFLLDFGQTLGTPSVLYPLRDQHVLLFSRYKDVLGKYFILVMPDYNTVLKVTTKSGLAQLAEEIPIPAPRTFFLDSETNIENKIKDMAFPVILKPTVSSYWNRKEISNGLRKGLMDGQQKVILCKTVEEFFRSYRMIASINSQLIVQEVIPGEDDRLVYISFYLDRQSKPLAIFMGRKHRVIPVGFGSASYARSFYDKTLADLAIRILNATRYQGFGGLEFKLDPRDGVYKVIEFNARFGMWDGLSVRCGINLPLIAHRDALGCPSEPQFQYTEGIIWVDLQRDLRAVLSYWKIGKLTPRQWLRSLRGRKMWAVYSFDDWRPGVIYTIRLLRIFWTRFAKFFSKNR